MADFDHPNVLPLTGITYKQGYPLVLMPLMDNGDLKKFISNEYNVRIKYSKLYIQTLQLNIIYRSKSFLTLKWDAWTLEWPITKIYSVVK